MDGEGASDTGALVVSRVGMKNKAQCLALSPLLRFVTREMSSHLCKLFFKERHILVVRPAVFRQPQAPAVRASSERTGVTPLRVAAPAQASPAGGQRPSAHRAGDLRSAGEVGSQRLHGCPGENEMQK